MKVPSPKSINFSSTPSVIGCDKLPWQIHRWCVVALQDLIISPRSAFLARSSYQESDGAGCRWPNVQKKDRPRRAIPVDLISCLWCAVHFITWPCSTGRRCSIIYHQGGQNTRVKSTQKAVFGTVFTVVLFYLSLGSHLSYVSVSCVCDNQAGRSEVSERSLGLMIKRCSELFVLLIGYLIRMYVIELKQIHQEAGNNLFFIAVFLV